MVLLRSGVVRQSIKQTICFMLMHRADNLLCASTLGAGPEHDSEMHEAARLLETSFEQPVTDKCMCKHVWQRQHVRAKQFSCFSHAK